MVEALLKTGCLVEHSWRKSYDLRSVLSYSVVEISLALGLSFAVGFLIVLWLCVSNKVTEICLDYWQQPNEICDGLVRAFSAIVSQLMLSFQDLLLNL